MANLTFYYGAMKSGKSATILITVHNLINSGKKVVLIKSAIDTKAGNNIQTRFGSVERQVDLLIGQDESLVGYFKTWKDKDYIYVDEAQFLTEEQVKELVYFSKVYNIPVVCYGLTTQFDLKSFPGSDALLRMADVSQKMQITSVCELCGAEATINARYKDGKKDGKIEISGDSIVIDGESSCEYIPLCMACYMREVRNIPGNMFYDIIRRDSELNNQEDYNNESKPKTLTKK